VLLMPYLDDEMIRQSNPLKLRECLATGKPTISIDVPEVRALQPHVDVATSRQEFVAAVRRALDNPHDAAASQRRQDAVRNDSWEARAKQLDQYLRELVVSGQVTKSCAPPSKLGGDGVQEFRDIPPPSAKSSSLRASSEETVCNFKDS